MGLGTGRGSPGFDPSAGQPSSHQPGVGGSIPEGESGGGSS